MRCYNVSIAVLLMQCSSISQFSISHQIADPINELETSKWIEAQLQKNNQGLKLDLIYILFRSPFTSLQTFQHLYLRKGKHIWIQKYKNSACLWYHILLCRIQLKVPSNLTNTKNIIIYRYSIEYVTLHEDSYFMERPQRWNNILSVCRFWYVLL